jgi:hypothetical protein
VRVPRNLGASPAGNEARHESRSTPFVRGSCSLATALLHPQAKVPPATYEGSLLLVVFCASVELELVNAARHQRCFCPHENRAALIRKVVPPELGGILMAWSSTLPIPET